MRKSRFTEEQMVKILREADRTSIPEVAKRHGVSEQTLYTWRKKFGELEPTDVKRLKQLEQENARLKRRACALLSVARSTLGYASRLAAKDAPVRQAMRRLAGEYPRFGYRRINVFLGREGLWMGKDRACRLWREEGLQVPRKRPRRRVASTRPRPQAPTRLNEVWFYDFVFDGCANGQQLKCLTVVDEYSRESLAIDVAGSIRSRRVVEVLAKLISVRGAPRFLRSDNGPEFVSHALLRWARDEGIGMAIIEPGKPWQNGRTESFNGKFRDECLSLEWFRSRAEARVVIEMWRQHYNEVRPHSSLGYLTPNEFKASCSTTTPERTVLQ